LRFSTPLTPPESPRQHARLSSSLARAHGLLRISRPVLSFAERQGQHHRSFTQLHSGGRSRYALRATDPQFKVTENHAVPVPAKRNEIPGFDALDSHLDERASHSGTGHSTTQDPTHDSAGTAEDGDSGDTSETSGTSGKSGSSGTTGDDESANATSKGGTEAGATAGSGGSTSAVSAGTGTVVGTATSSSIGDGDNDAEFGRWGLTAPDLTTRLTSPGALSRRDTMLGVGPGRWCLIGAILAAVQGWAER
jgi:hypothetical protein